MKICQCEKGFTNIYVLLNIKTKEKYIGTNQLKREEDILEKLFKLAHNEKRDTYNSELYKHLRLYSKNDFIIKVIKRDIEIGFITDEYKLDLLMSTFKNFKVEDLLSNKQKERLKEVATIQSIVDRIVNFKY